MVDFVSPVVLVPALLLLGVFVGLWHYRFAELPPVRAAVVVAVGAIVLVYSLVAVADLVADPVESVAILLGVLVVLAAVQYVRARAGG